MVFCVFVSMNFIKKINYDNKMILNAVGFNLGDRNMNVTNI